MRETDREIVVGLVAQQLKTIPEAERAGVLDAALRAAKLSGQNAQMPNQPKPEEKPDACVWLSEALAWMD